MSTATPPEREEGPSYERHHESNQKGVIVGVVIVIVLPFLFMAWWALSPTEQARREGAAATARVLRVKDTGNRFNDNPQVSLLLEVQPEQGEPWNVQVREVISVVELPRYQEGAVLDVRVHPDDRSIVVILGPKRGEP